MHMRRAAGHCQLLCLPAALSTAACECRLGPRRLVRGQLVCAHMVCAGARLLAHEPLRLGPRRVGGGQLRRAGQLRGLPRPQLQSAPSCQALCPSLA